MNRPEDKYVKIPAIIHATRIGYAYRSIREDAPGIDYDPDTNIFFEPFRKALERINGTPIDAERARHLANQIKLKASGEDLGRAFFTCLHAGIEEYRFIDFDDPSNNDFTVATELAYANGEDSFRPDITFLVNGMPLAFMEAKRQNNKDGILAEHEPCTRGSRTRLSTALRTLCKSWRFRTTRNTTIRSAGPYKGRSTPQAHTGISRSIASAKRISPVWGNL